MLSCYAYLSCMPNYKLNIMNNIYVYIIFTDIHIFKLHIQFKIVIRLLKLRY